MIRHHWTVVGERLSLLALVMCLLSSTAGAQMISPSVQPGSADSTITNPPTPTDCQTGSADRPECILSPSAPTAAFAPPPPALSGGSAPTGSGAPAPSDDKVLSYFQRGQMQIDTNRAFGFVLIPRSAITIREKLSQVQFCEIALATMDFLTPGAAARSEALPTYWPIVSYVSTTDVERAFNSRDCNNLIAWYDHSLARNIAAKAGLLGKSGPILITWPSKSALYQNPRDPLIVDFANADYAHATKALRYWFRQASRNPKLWRSYIREGTLRSELADAINDTAGVVLAVLSGKWNSLSVVGGTPQ